MKRRNELKYLKDPVLLQEHNDYIAHVRQVLKSNKINVAVTAAEMEMSKSTLHNHIKDGRLSLVDIYHIAKIANKKVVFDILPAERVNLTYQQQQDEIAKLKEIIISLTKEIDELKNLQPKTRTR